MKVIPYVNFYGNCEEALDYYQKIFNASVEIQRYSEMPPSPEMPIKESDMNKVMHAQFTVKDLMIYFSDNMMSPPVENSRVTLTVEFDTEAEIDAAFQALADGGQITMPLADQFWGAKFGSVIDKFGVYWALDFVRPQ